LTEKAECDDNGGIRRKKDKAIDVGGWGVQISMAVHDPAFSYVRFRFNVPCVGLFFLFARLSLHFSIPNFDNLVAKCSSNLFESLMPCFPAEGVNT